MALVINAKKRTGSDNDAIREAGSIPAVVYGPEMEPISIEVEARAFDVMYEEAGESTLVDLVIEGGEPIKVVVQDRQYHATIDKVLHADFLQVKMGEAMTVSVEIEFVGESQAVKQGGTLVTPSNTLEVTCLPKDLVSSIEVDLSTLAEFTDVIKVKDVALPAGLEATLDVDAIVASVSAPLTAEQIEAMEEAGPTSIEDVEVEEKGKKEDAEGEADADKKE